MDKEKGRIDRLVYDNSVSIPVKPGEIREYIIEINPTAIVLWPGHCLKLEIKSMNPSSCQSETRTSKVGSMNAISSNRMI